jgi:hypothetical protein
VRHTLAAIVVNFTDCLLYPIAWLFLVLLLRVLVRNQWIAALVAATVVTLAFDAATSPPMLMFFTFIAFGIFLFVLVRFGLLAGFLCMAFLYIGSSVPLTADASSWYAGRSLFALLVMAGIAVYAFYISLAGRQLFKGDALER